MIFNFTEKKKIIIVGLGVSGKSLANSLKKNKVTFFCWDDDKKIRVKATKDGMPVCEIRKINFNKIDFLVLSPGISHIGKEQHFSVKLANKTKCKIISDIEFIYYLKNKIMLFGITGTNGKSTTTRFLEHILKRSGLNAHACGNIGLPFTEIDIQKNSSLILESSSYQLERISKLKFNIAVLLNISEDHIERHKSIKNYISAKLNIFKNQCKNDTAILSIDDIYCQKISLNFHKNYKSNLIKISTKVKIDDGIFISHSNGKTIIINNIEKNSVIIPKFYLKKFCGEHNLQNLLASYACCKVFGLSNKKFLFGLRDFRGLEHRLELFTKYKNINFFNDSKSTNCDSAKTALNSMKNIYWIVGGRSKRSGLTGIENHLKSVEKAFTYGENSIEFFSFLKQFIATERFDNLEEAYKKALFDAKKMNKKINILLSPASASFDQFENFEKRGLFFKKIVKKSLNDI